MTIFVTFGRNREWRLSATLGRDRKSQLVGIGRQMLRRHMRVAAHHRLRPPSAQFLKHPGGHVILPKPARPGVAKIVPTKVGDPCPPSSQDRQDRAGRRASAQFSTAIIPYPVAATGVVLRCSAGMEGASGISAKWRAGKGIESTGPISDNISTTHIEHFNIS